MENSSISKKNIEIKIFAFHFFSLSNPQNCIYSRNIKILKSSILVFYFCRSDTSDVQLLFIREVLVSNASMREKF